MSALIRPLKSSGKNRSHGEGRFSARSTISFLMGFKDPATAIYWT